MSEEIKLKRKTPIAIYLIIFFSFAYTVTIGTNWHSEPGTLADSGIYEEYGESLGLTYKSKNHREFYGGISGDAIHYIMIAMGRSEVSKTPYTYRVLVRILGFCKIFIKSNKTVNFTMIFYLKISFLWRG